MTATPHLPHHIPVPDASPRVEYVTDNARLGELCAEFSRASSIGLDTEFMRTRNYFPRLGLVQVGMDGLVALVDPLAVSDFGPLCTLFADPNITKVLHSCAEDIEVLTYLCGAPPSPVYDTQVAASFLGHGFQCSYQALVEALFGVALPKEETRSDWLRRPLSASQVEYAAQDVIYLPAIEQALSAVLGEQGRMEWATEEIERMVAVCACQQEPGECYLSHKSARSMNARELYLFRDLCAWREQRAMRRDLPRSFIMPDKSLSRIAHVWPENFRQLATIDGLTPGMVRRHGKRIVSMVQEATCAPEETLPGTLVPMPRSRRIPQVVGELREHVLATADELGLPPELLARKKLVTDLVHNRFIGEDDPVPEELKGWRYPVIGEALVAMLAERTPDRDASSGKGSGPSKSSLRRRRRRRKRPSLEPKPPRTDNETS